MLYYVLAETVIKCDHLSIPAPLAAMCCCWTADAGSELEHSSAKKKSVHVCLIAKRISDDKRTLTIAYKCKDARCENISPFFE